MRNIIPLASETSIFVFFWGDAILKLIKSFLYNENNNNVGLAPPMAALQTYK